MCGIAGVWDASKAAEQTFRLLHALQHRAQDFAGIATYDGNRSYWQRDDGLVSEVFGVRDRLDMLHGTTAIGHLRYPTVGDRPVEKNEKSPNMQPVRGVRGGKEFFLAHNGNLTNTEALLRRVRDRKNRIKTDMDSELIVRLIEQDERGFFTEALERALLRLKGSFSLLIMIEEALIAVRDPSGNRPLSVGWNDEHKFVAVASETCALDAVDAEHRHDVKAGTIEVFTRGSKAIPHVFSQPRLKRCAFEHPYYSHVTSDVFGRSVGEWRMRAGARLAEMYPVPGADIVVGVPDSGTTFANGWAAKGGSGSLSTSAVVKSGYAHRTFIARSQTLREEKVKLKFQYSRTALKGKVVVLLDDSIVRLTTMPEVVRRMRKAGAKEIHVRIAFPPIKHPCLYGIDTPNTDLLSAANLTHAEMLRKTGADSLEFLDLDSLHELLGDEPSTWCNACVTGDYWH